MKQTLNPKKKKKKTFFLFFFSHFLVSQTPHLLFLVAAVAIFLHSSTSPQIPSPTKLKAQKSNKKKKRNFFSLNFVEIWGLRQWELVAPNYHFAGGLQISSQTSMTPPISVS